MASFKELAKTYLEQEKDIHCKDLDDYAFSVLFSGDNCDDIRIVCAFNNEGRDTFFLKCYSISNSSFKGKEAAALALCNNLNAKFRWVKYCLNDDSEISAELDGIVEQTTCGQEVYRLLMLIIGIIDDSYPDIMRARFS